MQTTDPTAESAAMRTNGAIAERVEPLVLELIDAHETLIRLLERHRGAIATADGRKIEPIVHEEMALFERIAALDRQIREALGHGTDREKLTVTNLARSLRDPVRTRLTDSAAYLRALHSRAEVLRASVREASAAMANHLDGLMRQVAQRLSHAGTYGAAGRVESRSSVVTGLDVSL